MKFNINKLINRMDTYYDFLYDNDHNGVIENVYSGIFDDYRKAGNTEFDNLLSDVVRERQDFISSDREAASFMLAYFEQVPLKATKKKNADGEVIYKATAVNAFKWLLKEAQKNYNTRIHKVYEAEVANGNFLVTTNNYLIFYAERRMVDGKFDFEIGKSEDFKLAQDLANKTKDIDKTIKVCAFDVNKDIERVSGLMGIPCKSGPTKNKCLCVGFEIDGRKVALNAFQLKKAMTFLNLDKYDSLCISTCVSGSMIKHTGDIFDPVLLWNPNNKNFAFLCPTRVTGKEERKILGWVEEGKEVTK